MNEYRIIVDKSTVPVGTADKVEVEVRAALDKRGKQLEFDVVSNPEFLKEGAAISDFMKPDRIIVGTDNPRTAELLKSLYEPFNRNRDRLITMDVRSAELTKYAANAMLATKISFMNELANLAERFGADIEKVRVGIGSDPRIGYHFIYPGVGYGGSCFPKDVRALAKSAQAEGYDAQLLSAVEDVNDRQKRRIFEKINDFYSGELAGKTIAVWGLSFKPRTDDMREAPSRVLMEALWAAGADVRAYDPEAMDEADRLYPDAKQLTLCETANEALEGADALAIMTEWQEFRSPNFTAMKDALADAVIFDGRNLYEPDTVELFGMRYYAIGRGYDEQSEASADSRADRVREA
jgi:UDPglucose 6-dehydrogenase